MKHKRGEIIAKHLDEIFLDGYEDKMLERFKKIKKGICLIRGVKTPNDIPLNRIRGGEM